MMPTDPAPKKVDEDWKAQIDRERQQVTAARPAAPQPAAPAGAERPAHTGKPSPRGHQYFEAFISGLSMEALIALGDIPHPATNLQEANLEQAKYLIDILGMLADKTQGNLTPNESQLLEDAVYQLRMRFVEKTQPPIPPPPGGAQKRR